VLPRRLVLVRHAQAAHAPADRERPLSESGAQAATAIGSWLERAGVVPNRVLVSPALRAAQTWERAAAALGADLPPTLDQRIYDNTVEAVLSAITETPDDVSTLVVVGHNPSVGELAFALDDGDGDRAAREDLHAGFPTGAVAVFELGTSFAELAAGAATLTEFEVPGD
jgi:phosphohistidine phosphatase